MQNDLTLVLKERETTSDITMTGVSEGCKMFMANHSRIYTRDGKLVFDGNLNKTETRRI